MTNPFGLSPIDLAREAERFGVSDEQVRRDHAISHVLATISDHHVEEVIFFGGTALSRTHLLHARLSEDIDLLALAPRRALASRLTRNIESSLLRTHGRVSWNPDFALNDDVYPAILETADGIAIRIQLLDGKGYSKWPVELRQIEQRYRDVGPASLRVPTISSFAGWKADAWSARQAPRDLFDLWALAERGAINADAVAAFVKHGHTGRPTDIEWEAALGGQTRLDVGPAEALEVVRRAWAAAQNADGKA